MATVSSVTTGFFPTAKEGFTTTLASTISSGATTVPLNSVAGFSNGEYVVMVVDPTDATKKQAFTGQVDTSGVQITNVVWTEGSNTSHTAGATVVDYETATHWALYRKGLLVEHNQDGTHGALTADSLTVDGATTLTGALTVKSYDGWISPTDTWTYVSATSFKITGTDVSSQFPVGTKIKLTQTTVKYFYVTACSFSTDTTVTVTGGSDYSLANAAITSPGLSYDASPQGFPQWFNYTPTWSGITVGNATQASAFSMIGKTVHVLVSLTFGSTTSVSGATNITLPITADSSYSSIHHAGIARLQDANGADTTAAVGLNSTTTAQIVYGNTASTYLIEVDLSSTTPFTWTTSDAIKGTLTYQAA